jgi:hypothetical protein
MQKYVDKAQWFSKLGPMAFVLFEIGKARQTA